VSNVSIRPVVDLPISEQVILSRTVLALFGVVIVTTNTFAENDHLVGHDLGSKVPLAVAILPTASLEPALNIDLLSPGEMLITNLG